MSRLPTNTARLLRGGVGNVQEANLIFPAKAEMRFLVAL